MATKNYSEQLKDPRWQRKRLEIMQRDNFTCQLCGDKLTTLNVHHKKYNNDCKPWEYDNDTLVTICEHCHFEVEELKKSIKDFSSIKVYKSVGWPSGTRIMFLSVNGICSLNVYDIDNKCTKGFYFEDKNEISAIINIFKNAI